MDPIKDQKLKRRTKDAMNSREDVLKHPKYVEILSSFGEFIGINGEPKVEAWAALKAE